MSRAARRLGELRQWVARGRKLLGMSPLWSISVEAEALEEQGRLIWDDWGYFRAKIQIATVLIEGDEKTWKALAPEVAAEELLHLIFLPLTTRLLELAPRRAEEFEVVEEQTVQRLVPVLAKAIR